MIEEINDILSDLKRYCERENFKGWDPFDGLNSTVFRYSGLSGFRIPRLIWMQLFKRNPINFRKIALVKKGINPQGIGLFLSAYVRIYKRTRDECDLEKIHQLYHILEEVEAKGWSGSCWGYNFDWQARAFFQPAHTPTVVPTVYAAQGILDYYDLTGDQKALDKALSVCEFLIADLNKTDMINGNFALSYSPLDNSIVYNISLHISNFLARVFSLTGKVEFKEIAGKLAEYCVLKQHKNGSWTYGQKKYHQWIDSFHTGYNLECLHGYSKYTGDNRYDENIEKGLEFYLTKLFDGQGRPGYYTHKVHPFDINSVAQSVITLAKLGRLGSNRELVDKILIWTFDNLKSEKGYFYFRKTKYFTNKIPYMRWSQAWMMYALVIYLEEINNG